jgi:RNA polymerase sigma factor (TIGR02999 family)
MADGHRADPRLIERAEAALARIVAGDQDAYDDLIPLIYDELHLVARTLMHRERPHHTLQTTALVNEACIRLLRLRHVVWEDQAHFIRVAASAMRRVLVDHARGRNRHCRGSGKEPLPLEEIEREGATFFDYPDLRILALDAALDKLSAVEERKARVVELLYFGGLTREETAEVLGVTPRTVFRDWSFARLWLIRELEQDAS